MPAILFPSLFQTAQHVITLVTATFDQGSIFSNLFPVSGAILSEIARRQFNSGSVYDHFSSLPKYFSIFCLPYVYVTYFITKIMLMSSKIREFIVYEDKNEEN
jgi:hypothetical protein